MEKKTIIAVLLCIGVLLIWEAYFLEKPLKSNEKVDETVSSGTSGYEPEDQKEGDGKREPVKEKKEKNERPGEKTVRIDHEKFEAVWSTRGASLKNFIVKEYKERTENKKLKESDPKDLVSKNGEDTQLFHLRFNDKNTDFIMPDNTDWSIVESGKNQVWFQYVDDEEKQLPVITKKYSINEDSFIIDLEVELANRSDESLREQIILDTTSVFQKVDNQQGCMSGCVPASASSPRSPVCRVNGGLEQLEPKPGLKQMWEPTVFWTGISEQYFLISMTALDVEKAVCMLEAGQNDRMRASIMYPEATIPPGGSVTHRFRLFVGPKKLEWLQKVKGGAGQTNGDAMLSEAVDFGWLSFLCYPMLWLMKAIQGILKNWGVAIIFLTVIIKILLLPLTQKMMKSQKEMGKLKPIMDDLKKKYAEDKQKLNEEMMKLFKANKVNPMSGCFPMLLQMPIWFALYRVLFSSVELYQTPFIGGWIDDLSYRDPYYIMPIVMGASMFLQQKLSPTAMDNQQAKMMMYFMPIFFTFIMLYLPSGLVLYIFVNNILSIGHQVVYNRVKSQPVPVVNKSQG